MPRGGARPGSGPKPGKLADLVEEGRFDPRNQRHRQKLFRDDLPLGVPGELRHLQETYRVMHEAGIRSSASSLADLFAHRVHELADRGHEPA